jgi:pilus assembly protein CpaB
VFGPGGDGPDRSESRTLLQNIKVLTVGPTLETGHDRAAGAAAKPAVESRALTLAMLPDQIGPFTLARKLGRFFLVLRNPNDRTVAAVGRAGLPSLRGGDMPRVALPGPVAAARRSAPSRPIELIVGGQRQIIYPGASGR